MYSVTNKWPVEDFTELFRSVKSHTRTETGSW